VPSRSRNKSPVFGLVLPLFLACCAGAAPALPPDTTSLSRGQSVKLSDFSSSDAALTCQAIAAERVENAAAIDDANKRIASDRVANQAILFVVPIVGAVAANGHDEDRAEINRRYGRQDELIRLAGVKKCPVQP
jgi:hypothetical protein